MVFRCDFITLGHGEAFLDANFGGGAGKIILLFPPQHIMVQVVTAAVAAIAFASLLILYEPSTSTTQLSAASMGTKLSKQTIQGSP